MSFHAGQRLVAQRGRIGGRLSALSDLARLDPVVSRPGACAAPLVPALGHSVAALSPPVTILASDPETRTRRCFLAPNRHFPPPCRRRSPVGCAHHRQIFPRPYGLTLKVAGGPRVALSVLTCHREGFNGCRRPRLLTCVQCRASTGCAMAEDGLDTISVDRSLPSALYGSGYPTSPTGEELPRSRLPVYALPYCSAISCPRAGVQWGASIPCGRRPASFVAPLTRAPVGTFMQSRDLSARSSCPRCGRRGCRQSPHRDPPRGGRRHGTRCIPSVLLVPKLLRLPTCADRQPEPRIPELLSRGRRVIGR